jgi:hypothetical protein
MGLTIIANCLIFFGCGRLEQPAVNARVIVAAAARLVAPICRVKV